MPKGERDGVETALQTAEREFHEETGMTAAGPYLSLGERLQTSGKRLTAFACAGDGDATAIKSNTCVIEWPPGSGQSLEIPEIDRSQWVDMVAARPLIRPGQIDFLDELQRLLSTVLMGGEHDPGVNDADDR